ncbi:hypothetical protein [Kitasatospora purpeofusca]|uniref:Carrier domain-containing protein n=1 Tax=Kitasatospora purpeofusca TaxID=67352 RepID=A0ABZ1UBJ3_9ACTN|nr:hypothetical protein [Kitasatospora purpeofusca]
MSSVDETQHTWAGDDPVIVRATAILAQTLGHDVAALRPGTVLADGLGAGEEDLANVASLLEMELDIDGLYEDVDDWETVGDILDSVHDQTA